MENNITLTFFSNFLLHHQTPFCEAMIKRIGDGFHFVATEPTPDERINMGYRDYTDIPYVVYSYKDEKQYKEALRLGAESDVVIIGSAPDVFIEERIKQNKLTFRYNERFFKEDPRVFRIRYNQDFKNRNKNLYMLCASAYTAPDCRFIFSYPHKTYKWGYFPEIDQSNYDDIINIKSKNKRVKVLWVSRFIKLKHPEEVIVLAEKLKLSNYDFEIEMVGVGELREHYERIVKEKNLTEQIKFSGPFSPNEILDKMKAADIFLFTSDRNEGWGAVLNESMSCGCAVVACKEIGSVPYLIKDGENGLIYSKKNKNSLYNSVERLIDDTPFRAKIRKSAYETIKTVWNAECATDRLLTLIKNIEEGTDTPFSYGPCSKA